MHYPKYIHSSLYIRKIYMQTLLFDDVRFIGKYTILHYIPVRGKGFLGDFYVSSTQSESFYSYSQINQINILITAYKN